MGAVTSSYHCHKTGKSGNSTLRYPPEQYTMATAAQWWRRRWLHIQTPTSQPNWSPLTLDSGYLEIFWYFVILYRCLAHCTVYLQSSSGAKSSLAGPEIECESLSCKEWQCSTYLLALAEVNRQALKLYVSNCNVTSLQ